MTVRTNIRFIIFLALLMLTVSCSKKSTVETDIYMTIYIQVTNEFGDPIPDAVITTNPATITTSTGSDGKAVIENVTPRSYSVIVTKTGSPSFNKYVKLEGVSKINLNFVIFSTIEITIQDEVGRLISNARIKTNPETQTVTTDSNGKAVLQNVPERAYQFTIERPDIPPINYNVVIDETTPGTLEFEISSEKPVATILNPADNKVFGLFEITFEGTGTDYEDGELPGSSLVWSSNIDGILGTGNTLATDKLSLGNHIITLTVTDSDNKTGSARITTVIVDYNPNSYFPMLESTSWEYRHQNPIFFVVNSNNVNELWEINNLSIYFDNKKRRISTVYYDITIATVKNHLKYTIIDNLEEVDNNIYATSTSEKIIEWKADGTEDNPYLTMTITTEYSPDYLIINDITNPTGALPLEFTVRAATEWSSVYFNTASSVFHETFNLVTKIEAGSSRYIQTDKGFFKADEVIITTSDSPRTWWLTKGVGIVEIEYTISDLENTAILVDSDLIDFYREETPEQALPALPVLKPYPVKTLRISRETGEGMMELRNFLRSMTPGL